MNHLVAVACGGALGAICRYSVGLALVGTKFGYGTLIVNVVGCFAIGVLVQDGLVGHGRLVLLSHPGVRVGFLGALTTFSTFGFETVRFMEQGEWRLAAINVLSNLVLGVSAVIAGGSLSRWMTTV